MPVFVEITFLPEGGVEQLYLSSENHYVLPDGGLVEIRTTPVWCRRCGRVTEGEVIEALEEAERELEQAGRRRAEILSSDYFPHELGVPFSRDWLEELRRRLRWRSLRTSPPRCIFCGTTEIFFFPDSGEMPHPAGTGTIRAKFTGFYEGVLGQASYTPEGERIAQEGNTR